MNDMFIKSMRALAPYYPKIYKVERDHEWITYKTDRGRIIDKLSKMIGITPPKTEKKEEITSKLIAMTTKVRHYHKGTWYTRHHITRCVCPIEVFEDPKERDKFWEQVEKEFLHQVYYDLKFGEINPDFKRPDGEPLDPVDDLQINEKQRLL